MSPWRSSLVRPFARRALLLAFLVPAAAAAGARAARSADEPVGEPPVAAAPKLRFGENEIDYGLLLQGEIVEKELKLHNDGGAPLTIAQAVPSCGCTTILEFPKEIAPGGEGTVRFTVDSRRINPGEGRKRIKFETNDPAQPQAPFYFFTEVRTLYRSEPPRLEVSGIYDGTKKATIRLIGITDFGFELLGARSRGGKFEIVDFSEAGEGIYELHLEVGPAARPEQTRDPLDLRIGLRDGRELEVGQWVDIVHLDPIEVIPEAVLQFDNRDTDPLLAAGAAPAAKSVVLRSRDRTRPFKILGVKLEGFPEGVFTTAVETVSEGTQYQVRVSLSAYRDEAFLLGKLLIETDAAVEPVRTIHLRAKFGRKR